MERRGRSTAVSRVALARQRSAERRTKVAFAVTDRVAQITRPPKQSPPKASTSRLPDPTPSRSLTPRASPPSISSDPSLTVHDNTRLDPRAQMIDRIHVAYARGNFSLARRLLCELEGTPDRNPDSVADEEFDPYFCPCALDVPEHLVKLNNSAAERAKVWESNKREMEARKEKVKKELAADKRARAVERKERERKALEAAQRLVLSSATSGVMPSELHLSPERDTSRAMLRKYGARPSPVSWKEILDSMSGPLFPPEADFVPTKFRKFSGFRTSPSSSSATPKSDSAVLLSSLLCPVDQTGRRASRGKERAIPPRRTAPASCAACRSLSSTSGPSSPGSSTAPSRAGSWLSFASSSRRSTSTAATTPSTSPPSAFTWLKSATVSSPPSSASSDSLSLFSPISSPAVVLKHSCCHSMAYRVSVPTGFCPLTAVEPKVQLNPNRREVKRQKRSGTKPAKFFLGAVADIAKGLQDAYLGAALFSISTTSPLGHTQLVTPSTDTATVMGKRGQRPTSATCYLAPMQANPPGARVTTAQVAQFISPTEPLLCAREPSPLRDMVSIKVIHQVVMREPYPLPPPSTPPGAFQPASTPFRLLMMRRSSSPAPLRTLMRSNNGDEEYEDGSSEDTYSFRTVSNPAHLRLKALAKTLRRQGVPWEGCGHPLALGGGQERIDRFTFDARRRSGLSWECVIES